ncbi:unnamed protein product [Lampetra planeri]
MPLPFIARLLCRRCPLCPRHDPMYPHVLLESNEGADPTPAAALSLLAGGAAPSGTGAHGGRRTRPIIIGPAGQERPEIALVLLRPLLLLPLLFAAIIGAGRGQVPSRVASGRWRSRRRWDTETSLEVQRARGGGEGPREMRSFALGGRFDNSPAPGSLGRAD